MDVEKRYNYEKEFFDKHASRVLDATQDFKIANLSKYEDLFEKIDYLNPIIDFWGDISNKKVLDLACGDGWISLSLAKSGAMVYGFDISPQKIELARRYAEGNSLNNRTTFDVMTSEEMTYDDNFFDYAIMHAALHHCDIEKTLIQIHRVLKPGGKAVLIEDYAYHPLMGLYRWLTPGKHTETERALTDDDLKVIVSRFSTHHYKYFGLLNLFELSSHSLVCKMKPYLRSLDNFLYDKFPFIKKYSKLIGIFVVK